MQAGVAADGVGRSSALDESLARAHQLAVTQGHGSVALEHLLFALTDDAEAASILSSGRGSLDQLRTDVSAHIGRLSETMPGEAGKAPVPGADLLRILQLAGMAARQSQRRTIDGGIVLAAVIGDGNSAAAGLLKAHGLTFDDAIRALQQVGTPRQPDVAHESKLDPRPEPKRVEIAAPQAAATSADDVLAATRARVKKSEPKEILPVVAPPPPIKVTPPAPPPLTSTMPPSKPVAVTLQPRPQPEPLVVQPSPERPVDVPPRPATPQVALPPLPPQNMQQVAPPPLARLRHVGQPVGQLAGQPSVAALAPLQPPMHRPHAPPPAALVQPPPRPMPPQPQRGFAPPHPAAPPPVLLPIEPLDIVGAAGGLPASVRRYAPVLIEIRIPRAQVDVPRQGPYAQGGASLVRAVTVRLTSGPVSGLSIEPRTPETAWLGPAEGEANARDIVWQFVLLPTRPGTFAVTLHVAGRTITPGGMTSDVASSAETFAVKVKGVRGSFLKRLSSWLMLLAIGGALGWALTGPLSGLVKALVDAVKL